MHKFNKKNRILRLNIISFTFQVVEVNGINVEGKTPNDVLMILKMAENTITFKLIPNETKVSPRESRDDTDRETYTLVLLG